ncbi:Acetoacetate-CoA ligase [Mucor velutinosus]|uniref:Acetoacetate-CoA ligase n=1 Tax=Mucor velutinosus TaxID=708070 RepID=A0AAN7HZ23_9FUNG|nr:Acetoacetate-CoA ligase [Mucor velutinosus]
MMHSTSTSSLHYFDSIKWKKRLHKISDKLHRSHNSSLWNVKSSKSATALAAATEKYIRTESTEIAIHSEDLTASQFANLTGIKTKRNSTTHSIYSSDDIYSDSEDDSEDDYYSTMATSTKSGSGATPAMKIWDSHFWQDGRKSLPTPIITTPLTKSTSLNQVTTAATATKSVHLTCQPLVRNKSEPAKSSCVQKGRFKIVWGQEDTVEIKPQVQCVEWKRKRASSNPIQQ